MYTIIDIEGNGAPFRKEKIIEIAIYRYDGHKITDQFLSLVNPESKITPYVQKLTSISEKMVITAPKFHELAKRVVEITEGTTLVGHNIDFDYRMLRQEFKTLGYDFEIDTIDTIPLAKKLLPDEESYSLSKLVKSLGIPLTNAHRASGDARATLDLFKLLLIKDQNSEILQMHKEDVHSKIYLNKIRELTHDLPNDKGIVYFQNREGKILHMDFTDSINKFAKKILSAKSSDWENVQEEIGQVNFEFTGSTVISKLILATKGLQKEEIWKFGLHYRNGRFRVEKLKNNEEPLLKFNSYTQGLKAVKYINSLEKFQNLEEFQLFLKLENRNELWLSSGRTLGEKCFLILKNGKVTSYGFYELYTQIKNEKAISKLKIEVEIKNLENDLKLALLKNEFQILPLPEKI
ncbi:3'-5' exonuclease [Frigoriflavimonas asaccharolytica]|uniref:DNA polymerase-3 subunit epsilon n=1 Tax=Frigoriflavimonas asaccharolytica TaxID=2735899 RepID=A0A8J8GCD2_9FLAO|nr:3'-5' exonuclease [Frigoriflavimonas asaccharolytica]NRS93355.1 DNA polymerase-3 subunit epsilon [Frigoriflavimonas asaccharolytica]